MSEQHEDAGSIKLDAEVIRYGSVALGSWEMPLAELKVLGEWTSSHAPSAGNWFLAFVAGADCVAAYSAEAAPAAKAGSGSHTEATQHGRVLIASAYAGGYVEFMVEAGTLLGAKLIATLHGSADFRSRVLWPSELEGKGLFEFYREPARGLWQRLKAMLGLAPMRHRLSREVAAFLEGKA